MFFKNKELIADYQPLPLVGFERPQPMLDLALFVQELLSGLCVSLGQTAIVRSQRIQLGNDIGITTLDLAQFRPRHDEHLFSANTTATYYSIFWAAQSRK